MLAYDERGNRKYDDNTSTLTHDRREYTYDGRRNVVNIRGEYMTGGGAWHFYDVASAFDARNRRVYKSFYDETSTKTSTWFFYYDVYDRLTEVRYTPLATDPGTYSVFDLFWLDDRLTLHWQTDYVSSVPTSTSKRYVATDEAGRPIKLWTWPSSGSTTNVWAINPTAWGVDKPLVGTSVFQPILFPGQFSDPEAAALEDDGTTVHRPGDALSVFRSFDPFIGSHLQVDQLAAGSWSSYGYAGSDPVNKGASATHRHDVQDLVAIDGEEEASADASGGNGLPPGQPAPDTFPGDRFSGLSGCFPTSRYDRLLCGACLADGSLRCGGVGGCFWQCLFNGVCTQSDIDFLNDFKHDLCGGPTYNYVCEVNCDGFHPTFKDHHSGLGDRPESLTQ